MEFLWMILCNTVGIVVGLYITVFAVVFLVGRTREVIEEGFKIESIMLPINDGWTLYYSEAQFAKPFYDTLSGRPITTNTIGGIIDTLVREGRVVRKANPYTKPPEWRISRPPS